MSGNLKIFTCLLFCCLTSTTAKLGDYITVCSAKDPKLEECVLNSAQQLIEKLRNGIAEYDLPPIDPMNVPIVDFRKAGMGLTLVIKNSTHSGIGNLKFTKATVDPANYHFELETILPTHLIKGIYRVDGRIMMLPIMGQGYVNITLSNVEGKWSIQGEPIEKNGVKYMEIKNFRVSVTPSLMKVNLENLFHGNKLLGETLNEVLNAQWKDLYKYIKPGLDKSHSDVLSEFATKFFSKIPYTEMFKDL